MKATVAMREQASICANLAGAIMAAAQEIHDRAMVAKNQLSRGEPATPCLYAGDLAALVSRLDRNCGYFDALQALEYDQRAESKAGQ